MAELDKDGFGDTNAEGTTWTAGTDTRARMQTGAQETLDEAKRRAADLAGEAKQQGSRMFAEQKDAAAGQFDAVAQALRKTADEMQDDRSGQYLGYAAERIESLGQRLRTKDLDSLIADAEHFGRRSPGAFFAGSVVAGFLLARFLKSSSERRGDPERYRAQERMRAGFGEQRFSRDESGTRTSYMDTDAYGTGAQSGTQDDMRNAAPAPDGGAASTAPLPTDEPRGGNYGF